MSEEALLHLFLTLKDTNPAESHLGTLTRLLKATAGCANVAILFEPECMLNSEGVGLSHILPATNRPFFSAFYDLIDISECGWESNRQRCFFLYCCRSRQGFISPLFDSATTSSITV